MLPILGLLCALPTAALAQDRLVEACEVAVAVHARDVTLRFDTARRTGERVRLDFTFEGMKGEQHSGVADCGFREAVADRPPSLDHLEVMGRHGAGMFLKSYHAVWEHFAGPAVTLSAPAGAPPAEPEPDEAPGRRPREPFA